MSKLTTIFFRISSKRNKKREKRNTMNSKI
jgi:hypothetical protein